MTAYKPQTMAEYKLLHQACPKCNRIPGRMTKTAYPAPPDLNIADCACGWIGTVNELVKQKEKTMAVTHVTAEQVVAKYVETRDIIAAKTKELNAELAVLKDLQTKRENWLMAEMNRIGATSIKTPHGTSYIDTVDNVSVADWSTFFGWVQEGQKFDFLTHAVSKSAVKQAIEDGQPPPPGVSYSQFKSIKVRRA
ncbi:hypothetical protein JT06_17395 [Desulfobulbus sp. Tol-SR]|nr:hypothetical protein JT06_17395 [Desulfobulbus sp. Tol-SR]